MLVHLVLSLSVASGTFAASPLGQREEQPLAAYDYVIAGGGTAGLVVANRLTEDPKVTVLVLEAGTSGGEDCGAILQRCLGALVRTAYDWNVTTEPQIFLAGDQQSLTIGRALGGSSLLNGMMFDRGSPGDYDMWEDLGNEGWGWKDLLPYFKKSENFTPPKPKHVAQFGITYDPSAHGNSGYVQSGYPNFIYPQNKNFQDALKSLGVSQSKDQAGSALGVFWSPNTIDPKNMTRSYSRNAYYDRFTDRRNLHVMTSRHVTKLLTKSDKNGVKITGIQFVEPGKDKVYTVIANKEYVVSAGAVHTPQILQLSGIGQKSLLKSLGIPVVIDLPGVGQNFQDHQFGTMSLQLDNVEHSIWDLDRNATWDALQRDLFYASREGTWTSGGPNSVAFLPLSTWTDRSKTLMAAYTGQTAGQYLRNDSDPAVTAGHGAQRKVMLKYLATKKIAAMEFIWQSGSSRRYQMPFSISVQHPFSRGYIEINTTDPLANPVIDMRTGSNPVDLDLFVEGFRYSRRVVQTPAIQALAPTELTPGALIQSDKELLDFAKSTVFTMFHPCGTSAMQPRKFGGVVNNKLQVYGVTNLRIVDASIIPMTPATHLVSTVYAIAEKAADMMKAAN